MSKLNAKRARFFENKAHVAHDRAFFSSDDTAFFKENDALSHERNLKGSTGTLVVDCVTREEYVQSLTPALSEGEGGGNAASNKGNDEQGNKDNTGAGSADAAGGSAAGNANAGNDKSGLGGGAGDANSGSGGGSANVATVTSAQKAALTRQRKKVATVEESLKAVNAESEEGKALLASYEALMEELRAMPGYVEA